MGAQGAGDDYGGLSFSGKMLGRIAIDSAYANASGKFLQSRNGRSTEQRSSAASYDEDRAGKLWADSSEVVKLTPKEQPRLIEKP